ncbi:hypothetical protein [Acinetobacter larvae]|uniref:SH3 domain protein n=1 Tax=Acinetobacter larvae TaxID=1789224 RepID=A0A1B2M262_9GAMM|nr:hypothetical protein [Acinetobacter larvae]AOA59272.1 hypothetical protein BFG52_13525 [Acinetobacter larvae]
MRVIASGLLSSLLFLSHSAWAVTPTNENNATPPTTASPSTTANANNNTATTANTRSPHVIAATPPNKAPTAEQLARDKTQQEANIKALVKDQSARLQQLEKANLDALTQNQELKLKNDNLGVQVQVLQSESSAQMFLYGAMTLALGVILGFLIASYIYTKRRRQW